MADFAPPSGPPPPKVPEGWKAVWNDQYKEWFYVNIHTKKSQWDKPTEPVYAVTTDKPPTGPPPAYESHPNRTPGPEKSDYGSNNPYRGGNQSADERLAQRLQEEEKVSGRGSGPSDHGAAGSYYSGGSGPTPSQNSGPYGQQRLYPPYAGPSPGPLSPSPGAQSNSKGGFFDKLSSKFGGGGVMGRPSSQSGGYGGYGGYPAGQQYGGYPPPPQQQYGGGYPPQQQYGGYPPQQSLYQPTQGSVGYYGGQQPVQQPQKKHGIGAGTALLGGGAALLGGAVLMDAFEHHEDRIQEEAYDQGYDQGFDNGDDWGGGDDFGGDF